LTAGGARLLHGRIADLRLLLHLRGVPEIADKESSVSALEGSTQAARLEQIALHHLDTALLERLGRCARRIAAGHTNYVLARGQQRVDDAASLGTGTTDDCNGLLGHVRLLFKLLNQYATMIPTLS